ncbi:MAG TPA: DegT/DnrJ/EryC1/StrS family aminotransferase, partial [Acidimicrobiia bacterium]|nr:DegT/DnrJ/EryC1/StrS family aminotransferase [Acidimicrobiia bacterium]
GFGRAEVFSLTPTKPLVAGEGGLVATDDDDLAHAVRIGRDYANPGDYDTQFVGLNGRMSELHAAVALASLEHLDEHLAVRRELAARYVDGLATVPGVAVQVVDAADESTYKDFTIAIDAATFGVDRDAFVSVLRAEGVDTRCYFDPPVHRQHAYVAHVADTGVLERTDRAAASVVSLPIYPSLAPDVVDRIVAIARSVHACAADVGDALGAATS